MVHPRHQQPVRCRCRHVEAGALVQLVRIIRAAGAQHRQEALARRLALGQDRVGEVGRADHRGRVLVHVEIVVKVRDEGPFDAICRVDLHHSLRLAVVGAQQAAVHLGHPCAGQRPALLELLVDRELELGKHHLAEERGANRLECDAQVVQLLRPALGVRHHVVGQQHLVADRCRLGDEGRVAGFFERLRAVGQQRMHCMAPFVRENRQRVVVAVVIQQQVRVYVVRRAVHVAPGRLARVRIDVHPAALEAAPQQAEIVFAQRLQCVERDALGVVDAEGRFRVQRE